MKLVPHLQRAELRRNDLDHRCDARHRHDHAVLAARAAAREERNAIRRELHDEPASRCNDNVTVM